VFGPKKASTVGKGDTLKDLVVGGKEADRGSAVEEGEGWHDAARLAGDGSKGMARTTR
jgi:hypothetical protein